MSLFARTVSDVEFTQAAQYLTQTTGMPWEASEDGFSRRYVNMSTLVDSATSQDAYRKMRKILQDAGLEAFTVIVERRGAPLGQTWLKAEVMHSLEIRDLAQRTTQAAGPLGSRPV